MRHNTIHITTFVILVSILSITAQFCMYYIFDYNIVIFGLAAFINLISVHILFEKFNGYETCFSYLLLNCFLWSAVGLLTYIAGSDGFLVHRQELFYLAVLSWAITTLYCIIRRLKDHSDRFPNFNAFFRNSSILFIVFYTAILIYELWFSTGADQDIYQLSQINPVPFLTMASVIEDFIKGLLSPDTVIRYFTRGILLFLPYGFYIVLLLRHKNRYLRAFVLLLFSFAAEAAEAILLSSPADIDNVLLALIGLLLGDLLYHLVNHLFLRYTDRDFLASYSGGFYAGRNLHF